MDAVDGATIQNEDYFPNQEDRKKSQLLSISPQAKKSIYSLSNN